MWIFSHFYMLNCVTFRNENDSLYTSCDYDIFDTWSLTHTNKMAQWFLCNSVYFFSTDFRSCFFFVCVITIYILFRPRFYCHWWLLSCVISTSGFLTCRDFYFFFVYKLERKNENKRRIMRTCFYIGKLN